MDTIEQVAFENGNVPVGSHSDNIKKATELSTNPNLMKLAETYQTYYNFGQAFDNASKGILIMAEGGLFLEYNIRAAFTDKYVFKRSCRENISNIIIDTVTMDES